MSDMKTITDLIQELEQIRYEHGDLPVLVDGYEDDFDAPNSTFTTQVVDRGEDHKSHTWWNGRYEDAEFADAEPGEVLRPFKAVVIPR